MFQLVSCGLLGRIISLSWHPSGTLIAAGMMDMIRIFDAETGKQIRLDPEMISTEPTASYCKVISEDELGVNSMCSVNMAY